MADKIVTDDILQKAIQDTIQIIADNIFEFESYSDESIAELFSLTPEEAQHISDLIADTVISQYKLWSSKKVNDELLNAKNECNDYTDTRLANISSISLKYCTALPSVGESNCIYILKSTDSNPDTLNLYDGTWISIGRFTISLDNYYTKAQIDTKLDLKADKTEILAQDDVITDTSLATTTNVLSATTTIKELDKKVDKTSIVTSISSTSTDDTVPSAKAVYSRIKNMLVCPNDKSPKEFAVENSTNGQTIEFVQWGGTNSDSISQYATYKFTRGTDGNWGVLVATVYDTNYRRNIKYCGFDGYRAEGSKWGEWQKVYATNIDNVDKTTLSFTDSTNYSLSNGFYMIRNGICSFRMSVKVISPLGTLTPILTLPNPALGFYDVFVSSNTTPSVVMQFSITSTGGGCFRTGTANATYLIEGSYPILES